MMKNNGGRKMNKERRWLVIDCGEEPHFVFKIGEILTFSQTGVDSPYPGMKNLAGCEHACSVSRLVEIDENGNTIRTYKYGDTLDGGTVVEPEREKAETVDEIISKVNRNRYVMAKYITSRDLQEDLRRDFFTLAAEVQRLRDEREKNPGLWTDAPDGANKVNVHWFNTKCSGQEKQASYTRTIKSTAQIIAEELTDDEETRRLIVEGIERAGKELKTIKESLSRISEFLQ